MGFVWENILVWESGNPRERFGLSSILLFSTLMPKSCLAMVTGQLIQYIHSPPYFHLGRHLMHLVQLQHLMHLMHLLYHLMHIHLFTLASSAPPVRCNAACTPIIIFYFISNYAVVWTLSTQALKTYPNKINQIKQFCVNVRCPKQSH